MESKRFSGDLVNKVLKPKETKKANALEVALEKRVDHDRRYKNLNQPIKIESVEADCKTIVLKDGSQWSAVYGFGLSEDYATDWAPNETVIVIGTKGGDSAVYTIKNISSGSQSRWSFVEYVDGRGPQSKGR